MSGPRGFDVNGETSRAWSAFARRLADRLLDMTHGETLTLGLDLASDEGDAGATQVAFTALPDGMLRRTQLSADGVGASEHLSRQGDADQLAADSVRLLREHYGVMHPAFLSVTGNAYPVSGLEGERWHRPDVEGFHDGPPSPLTEPVGSAEVLELAFDTITHDLGREPDRDMDGDLVIESGSTRVFVRVLERSPVLQLFGRLVHNIAQPEAAPAVVAELNSDYPFVKFLFADSAVLASVHIPAMPFVPAQLRHMLAVFSELVDELDDELVRRLGGEREIEHAVADVGMERGEPDGVPPELVELVRLDPDGLGVDPKQTAEVCGYDRALTRQLLHLAIGQEEAWHEAVNESADNPEDKARCADEAAGWGSTRRSLEGAMEVIDSRDG